MISGYMLYGATC